MICRGPLGPRSRLHGMGFKIEKLPVTSEILQEDVLLRFLASSRSKEVDEFIVDGSHSVGGGSICSVLHTNFLREFREEDFRVNVPTIVLGPTNIPIAIANNVWSDVGNSLLGRKVLDNGFTR